MSAYSAALALRARREVSAHFKGSAGQSVTPRDRGRRAERRRPRLRRVFPRLVAPFPRPPASWRTLGVLVAMRPNEETK